MADRVWKEARSCLWSFSVCTLTERLHWNEWGSISCWMMHTQASTCKIIIFCCFSLIFSGFRAAFYFGQINLNPSLTVCQEGLKGLATIKPGSLPRRNSQQSRRSCWCCSPWCWDVSAILTSSLEFHVLMMNYKPLLNGSNQQCRRYQRPGPGGV